MGRVGEGGGESEGSCSVVGVVKGGSREGALGSRLWVGAQGQLCLAQADGKLSHPVTPLDLSLCIYLCLRAQIAPHILIHWRPDEGSYKAFLTRKAPAGSKVDTNPAIDMSVLPNTKGMGDSVTPFTVWHTTKEDDSDMMSFICGPVVSPLGARLSGGGCGW